MGMTGIKEFYLQNTKKHVDCVRLTCRMLCNVVCSSERKMVSKCSSRQTECGWELIAGLKRAMFEKKVWFSHFNEMRYVAK